jgi:hypothetical protein
MLADVNSVNGEWTKGGGYPTRVFVEITPAAAGDAPDFVFQTSTDGRNFVSVVGASGFANPVNINVANLSTNLDNYTVFHEVLHEFGLWHQWNNTHSVMSYSHSKEGSYRRILTSDVDRLRSAYGH